MKEHGILFSAPMVRAILAGTKTQTRRIVKMTDRAAAECGGHRAYVSDQGQTIAGPPAYVARICNPEIDGLGGYHATAPHGPVGRRLWVKETWQTYVDDDSFGVEYRADGAKVPHPNAQAAYEAAGEHEKRYGAKCAAERALWTPSIHMPRWASRITLEVTRVRLERVQDITEEDARAEGVPVFECDSPPPCRQAFAYLWDSINGKAAPWASNPWVWVYDVRSAGT